MKTKSSIYLLIIVGILLSTDSLVQGQGKDYTFCYGSISVTLKDGGVAIMNRYSLDGLLIKSISGEYTIYGSPNDRPGQVVKIKYETSDEEFRYDFIRDGFGSPSVLIDGEGRNYKLCNTSKNPEKDFNTVMKETEKKYSEIDANREAWRKAEAKHPVEPMSRFVGYYLDVSEEYEMKITSIPYDGSKVEEMNWQPNEKRIGLNLVLSKKGVEVFNGNCIWRDKRLADEWFTRIAFSSNGWMYRAMLSEGKTIIRLYKNDPQGNTDWGFTTDFNKVGVNEFKNEINRYNSSVKVVNEGNTNISSTSEGFSSFTDSRDGKVYKTIKIGTQTWMESNLNVEKFRNGDPILYAKTNQEWIEAGEKKTPAWCYYDGNPENGVKYGKLYNIYVLIDPRGLSPSGYRLPNDKDWDILVNDLGGKDVAGSKMRQSPENGGFSGILSGQREKYGEFKSLNNLASWWSSDTIIVIPPHIMIEPPVLFGRFRSISKTNPKVINETRLSPFPFAEEEDFKGKFGGCGLSVRCIKDDN